MTPAILSKLVRLEHFTDPQGMSSGKQQRSLLVRNIKQLATFVNGQDDLVDAAIYVHGPEIQWVGRMAELPDPYKLADEQLDLSCCVVIPGQPFDCNAAKSWPSRASCWPGLACLKPYFW